MRCRICGGDSKVIDSRDKPDPLLDEADLVRRRRRCLQCGRSFGTKEREDESWRVSEANDFADGCEEMAELARRNPKVLILVEAWLRGEVLVINRADPVFGDTRY